MKEELSKRFQRSFGKAPDVVAQAPGRIEFIGNHTDYNGGYVMGVAIDKAICCALAKRDDTKICFANSRGGEKIYADIKDIKKFPREKNWANYPLGVVKYMLEVGMKAEFGFDMTDLSNLPSGSGLSSSAAIEMSACTALAKLYDFEISKNDRAKIGRKSENLFLEMPCGILDQGVSTFGKENSIVFIDCLSEEFSTYPLPATCKFYVFNSTKKHSLVEGEYAERHAQCSEAAKVLSEGGEPRLLRAFTLADLESKKDRLSPKAYMRAKHVIEENGRVLEARDALLNADMQKLGKLLFASHESSKTLFENSADELDALVDILKDTPNVYGARLSGGGFGGAVMALVKEDFSEGHAESVAKRYAKIFGREPLCFACRAGDGAKLI